MPQKKIPCLFMRGGTSRGPFLDLRDLPADETERNKVLLKIMGSPDTRQIDGLGGAAFVTSKVIMAEPSKREGIDVDSLFAQVLIDKPIIDTSPTCGNLMSGVAPLAIERGWVKATHPETTVMIYNYNTNSLIEAVVQTPNGKINYTDGDTEIKGVPGTGAPIVMNLINPAGGQTGKLFPTGNRKDLIQDIEISIVDAGNIMMLVKAIDFGLSGRETKNFFEDNKNLMDKIEDIRQEAGRMAGMGDVSDRVLPKVGLLTQPMNGGTIKSMYLTPHSLHPTHAVSGAVCIGTACKAAGTVAADLAVLKGGIKERIVIEHPTGFIPVIIEVSGKGDAFTVEKAGTLRTARKIMDGFVFVPFS